ncbi:MAG: hypothetical protein RIS24_2109, partial [Verrucomicrobiota bacterium]
ACGGRDGEIRCLVMRIPRFVPCSVRAWGVALATVFGACLPGDVSGAVATNGLHWSYRPLLSPQVPEVSTPVVAGAPVGSVSHPVDRFIRDRLQREGIPPAPEADRRTLLRRVSLDLTGLPPTPAEMDAFLNDPSADAYEQCVDRLLASPRHGERWARHWLDVVHYGETHGYDKDQPRPNAWPYRDYVIRALNADKPYSRFIREQIAGDVLWPDTEDGITATGFISAGPWDLIGHAEVPESKTDGKIARLLDRDDMVATVMNTFNSATVQCARCHDHKFDPVRSEEYYQLTAVFAALDRADRKFDVDPAVAARRRSLEARKAQLMQEKKALDEEMIRQGGRRFALLERRVAAAEAGSKEPVRPEMGWHSAIQSKPEVVQWVQVDLGRSVEIHRLLYAGCHDDFNGIGKGFGFPLRYRVELSDDPEFKAGVQRVEDQTGVDLPNPGVTPREVTVAGLRGRYVRVTATRLAARMNDFIFALSELEVLDAQGSNLALGAPVSASDSIEAAPRWGRDNLTDGWFPGRTQAAAGEALDRLRKDRKALEGLPALAASVARLTPLRSELEGVSREISTLPMQRVVYAGTVHHGGGAFRGTGPNGGKPRPVHWLARGDVRKPGHEVTPGVPRSLGLSRGLEVDPALPEGQRRVALAEWIADPGNVLTWRSIVNRVWQHHFGRGLVETANDFGRMGTAPSHPELLDWLAVWFRDNGQSLKSLHRLLVTSRTYRQSSVIANPETHPGMARDSDNRLLGRMNRRKLEAEAIRDSMLWVAGRLDERRGGPSFKDFVVERPEHSPHYEYALHNPEDPESHRRSVYRFLVRSQPQPMMAALDCADPSISVDRRNETLNALQALALMNHKLAVSMSRHWAVRLEREAPTIPERVSLGMRWAFGRRPTAEESEALVRHTEQHGLASTCRLMLNLNEFVFVD